MRLRTAQIEALALIPGKAYEPHPLGGSADPDASDAVLIPADVVEGVNGALRNRGAARLDALCAIRDARKALLNLCWETTTARATIAAEEALAKDLQLLQAVGVVREFIEGGNLAARGRADVSRKEQQLVAAKLTHTRSLSTLAKATERLEHEAAAKEAAVAALNKRSALDAKAVAVQEALFAAHQGPPRGDLPPLPSKEETMLVRERLKASVRLQAEEMRTLKEEIARLETRNYVKF